MPAGPAPTTSTGTSIRLASSQARLIGDDPLRDLGAPLLHTASNRP
jgi:hypothetical protein